MRARLFAVLVAALAAACSAGSNSIEVTAPSALKCQVTATNAMSSAVPPDGTSSTISIDTTRDCTWTASANAPWISITSAATGQGSGTVGYRVAANGEAVQRRAVIDVNNSQVDVVQEPAPCRFTVTPASATVDSAGAVLTITVEAPSGCAWSAASPVNWAVVTANPSGNRSGTVTIAVAVNAGAARTATLTIGGQPVTIQQNAASTPPGAPNPPPPPGPCAYTIAPPSANIGSDATSVDVAVTAGNDCAWTATSHDSWITVASAASGTGNGTVALTIAANAGGSRTGTITIADKTFTVVQGAAPCNYAIESNNQSLPFDGGTGSVRVIAGSACTWTATSNAAWISITSGGSGTGNGSVSFSVAANTGAARNGTLTIAGRTFTVTQAAAPPPPCTFSIAPGSQNISEAGGPGATTVTASAASCAWTATSNAPWITITTAASGTGNGRVEYTVAANTGAARSGTLTVAGQTLTVMQAAAPPPPCSWSIAPSSQSVSEAGAPLSTTVTASAPMCAWSAVSNVEWITITGGASGTGNGAVTFTVAANTGAPRTGTLTIAGQTFTVTQAAAPPPCTYSIAPPGAAMPPEGGSGTIAITASAPTCSWSAVSPDTWVAIGNPNSGSGNGTITFTVSTNTGAARTTTLTVAGQPFTVSQAAPVP